MSITGKAQETTDFFIPEIPDLNGRKLFFINSGLLFLSTPSISKLIWLFERKNTDIAFPITKQEFIISDRILKFRLTSGQLCTISILTGFAKNQLLFKSFLEFYTKYSKNFKEQKLFDVADLDHAEEFLTNKHSLFTGLLQFDDPQALRTIISFDDIRKAEAVIADPWKQRFRKAKIIFNPRAGAGKPLPRILNRLIGMKHRSTDLTLSFKDLYHKILSYMHKFKIDAEIITLDKDISITNQTRRLIQNSADCIIAAGGDGTINSVVNALAYSQIPLGVIPLGTANVMAIEFSIPSEIRSACQLIAQGETRNIDLGKCNDRYFSCIAGVGIDAYITRHVQLNSNIQRRFGAMAYIITGFFDFFKYRFRPIKITIDNRLVVPNPYLVIVGNGKHYGGNLIFSPKAKLDDGLLDIVIFKSCSIFSVIQYLRGFLKGTLPDLESIDYIQGKSINIAPKERHHVHIDGDFFGYTPVHINVAPKALRIIC